VIAACLLGVGLVGIAYGMARRKAIAREQWKKKNMSKQDTVVNVQQNPLISTRGVPENASPQTVFQTLQQERSQTNPANIRRASFHTSPQQSSPPLHSLTPKPTSIVDQRRDLQVFQATTVRNIRQGRGGARIHGIRKDVV
jgi:hypothetical protein